MRLLVLGVLLSAAAAQNYLSQPVHLVMHRGDSRAVMQLAPVSAPHQTFHHELELDYQQHGHDGSQHTPSRTQESFSDSRQPQQTYNNFNQKAKHYQQGLKHHSHNLQQESVVDTLFHNVNQQIGGQFQNTGDFHRNEFQEPGISAYQQPSSQNTEQFQQHSQSFSSGDSIVTHNQEGIKKDKFQEYRADSQDQNTQFLSPYFSPQSVGLEEVSSIPEPLNLPSGARLLLGDMSSSFSCVNQPYGYYADEENSCKVFHVCYPVFFSSGRVETYQYSFMCGRGTRFDQKERSCVWDAAAIPCEASSQLFFRNAEFGLPEDKAILGYSNTVYY